MALVNPKLFGLDVNRTLADVLDKDAALNNLNLPPIDLEVIRGSKDKGATRGDWVSFSRLSDPIYKTLDRYYQESSLYSGLLNATSGTNQTLFGNLTINGRISGNAIRYRYVDFITNPTSPAVKIADISTSRVSAWSSVGVGTTAPISYGARVGIITGGQIQFGTQSSSPTVSGPRLQTTITPIKKEFKSEIPTHKIQCTIGGKVVNLYAMKGIPVVFKGFFRTLDATIDINVQNNIQPSWKIVDVDDASLYSNFSDVGKSLSYRGVLSKERYIQFYYSPDYITSIQIRSASISQIPEVKFSLLTSFDLANNNLVNFPNFNTIAPNLTSLNLYYNPFYNSDTPTERSLNSNIIAKIPTGLKNLYLGGTFYGSIPKKLISDRCPNLKTLDLSRSDSAYFYPDSADPNCTIPNVTDTCESYSVYGNDFRLIGTSEGASLNVKDLTKVKSINLGSNYYLVDSNFSISQSNTDLESLNIYNTGVSCPDLSNRTNFVSITASYNRNIGSIFSNSGNYKFNNCSALKTLDFYASSGLTGAMPKFTNSNLTYIDWRYTNIIGGNYGGTVSDDVIPEKTFENSPKLVYFFLQSANLLPTQINKNAFSYTPDLYYFWFISYSRTGGAFPSFASCKNLTWVVASSNAFNGTLYNFASNLNIYYIDLAYNKFSGSIPGFKNLSNLYYLYLYNNSFSGLEKFQNLPNLTYFYAHNNLITGQLPDFSGCPRLYYLILFNNQMSTYYPGSLSKLTILKYLDISNNNFSEQALNSIIDDLYTNYNSVKRGGVTVNIRSQATGALPTGIALEKIAILKSEGWTIAYE